MSSTHSAPDPTSDGPPGGLRRIPDRPDHLIDIGDAATIAMHELAGDIAAPPLLVCHATGFNAWTYRQFAAHLGARWRVIGIDLRGHGASSTPDLAEDADGRVPGLAWPRFADDVLIALDALDIVGAVGVGHSCGGATLLMAEAARPGTFSALWAYEPVIFPPDWGAGRIDAEGQPVNPLAEGARRRRASFASRAAVFERFAARPPLSWWEPAVLADYVTSGFVDDPAPDEGEPDRVRLACSPAAEAATFDQAASSQAAQHLDAVSCPTTIACGGERADFGEPIARWVADQLPAGRHEVFPELSHFGPFEAAKRIAEAIERAIPV